MNPKIRFDRLITLVLNVLKTPQRNDHIPVLMYHSVTNRITNTRPYYSTEISTLKFERHLIFLNDNNYRVYFLKDIKDLLNFTRNDTHKKYVIITFDDGYKNFYDNAFPLLAKHNIPATLFVPSGLIPESGYGQFEGAHLMNWVQIKECTVQQLIDIGSHSLMHNRLTELNIDMLKQELSQSKSIIENNIQKEVTSFSYPFRFPDENQSFISLLCALYKESGYTISVTTRIGTVRRGDNLYILKRIPVNEYDDLKLFKAKLEGSYDWLYSLQYLFKIMRSLQINKKKSPTLENQ
ncbi:MAG: polysaccharide deacetylase family protein [Chitinispirillaceae bacterium]|nr:polysaccharide deacetylase family protein [Chitinispirillaceae bacterium]